jgi:methyl-accepting chemotaxis protein
MTVALAPRSSDESRTLTAIASSRVWQLPAASHDATTLAVTYLLARLAEELRALDALVGGATERLATDVAELESTAGDIDAQARAVAGAHAAATALDASSGLVTSHAGDLQAVCEQLQGAIVETQQTIADVIAITEALGVDLGTCETTAGALGGRWGTVSQSVADIGVAGRHARVLAVNAAIEAAYASDNGGFGIVADRMRELSHATSAAAGDVGKIVTRSQESARATFDAARRARLMMETAASESNATTNALSETMSRAANFGDAVSRIAVIAQEQSASLPHLAGSVARVAELAQEVANSAQATAHGAMHEHLSAARAALAAHRGLERIPAPTQPPISDDPLACWLIALANGSADAASLPEDPDGIASAAFRLYHDVLKDQNSIVGGLCQIAYAGAQSHMHWRKISENVEAFDSEIEQLTLALGEARVASDGLGAVAVDLARDIASLEALCSATLAVFDRALDRVASASLTGAEVVTSITAMNTATDEAEHLLEQIADVSADAGLLALNAAVEAARAGDDGRGFTVIADEITRLANRTQHNSADVIAAIVAIREETKILLTRCSDQDDAMQRMREMAQEARRYVTEARTAVNASTARGLSLRETATTVTSSVERVNNDIVAARAARRSGSQPETELARRALSRFSDDALHVTKRRQLDRPEEGLRSVAFETAARAESLFNAALADGRIRLESMLSGRYDEMRGSLVERLAHLVDVSDAPRNGFDVEKYTTDWDYLIDQDLVPVLDAALVQRPVLRTAVIADINGFLIATPTSFFSLRDVGGRPAWPNIRIKRLFSDPSYLLSIRVGMGGALEQLPTRASRADFERAGCDLRKPTELPWKIEAQIFPGTGTVMRQVAVPLYCNATRVGTIVCYDSEW